jgi:hypothetical protein
MQSLKICSVNQSDKVLLTTTIDKCFMAGLPYFLGVIRQTKVDCLV